MIFANVKALSIPEGVVEKITIDGRVLWQLIKAKYTNQIPISTDASGNIYNGKGYKERTYINNGKENANNYTDLSGFMPCKVGDVIRLQNMPLIATDGNNRLYFYTADKTLIAFAQCNSAWYMNTLFKGVKDADGNYIQLTIANQANLTTGCAYIRISAADITESSIVTINEEIT
ncbi:MAG: hypothetical protein IKU47_01670 [Oscillospiraceae bacterium]|nr:hypothetical protein [Oscillospiraceae bacterium]